MDGIWKAFIDKLIDENTPIRKAYSNSKNLNYKWIKDEKGLTIQEWVNEICEQLMKEGHNLDETPLEKVREKFVLYEISYKVPEEYNRLLEAKKAFRKAKKDLAKWKATPDMMKQIESSIDIIDSRIKELL